METLSEICIIKRYRHFALRAGGVDKTVVANELPDVAHSLFVPKENQIPRNQSRTFHFVSDFVLLLGCAGQLPLQIRS